MKKLVLAFIFIISGSVAFAELPAHVVKAFYRVDKCLIASLYSSSKNDKLLLKHNFNLLKKEWNGFVRKYKGKNKNDKAWNADILKIKKKLSAISTNNPQKAHLAFEEIRSILMDMRTRNGISYYLDALNRFHKPMEIFVENVLKKHNKKWNKNDFDTLDILYQSLISDWNAVKETDFDEEFFGFSEKDMDKMETLSADCDIALENLQKAIKSQVPEKIEKAAKDLKKSFVSFYIFFGGIKK